MNIGIISDTHGYLNPKVMHYFAECDQIWHAGDIGPNVISQLTKFKPLKAVYGNIDDHDLREEYPLDNVFICQGLKIWITHIAGKPSNYTSDVSEKIKTIKPDIFVCGHSHVLCIKKDIKNNFLYINPGAAGKYGIHTVSTLVKLQIINATVQNLKVIEIN